MKKDIVNETFEKHLRLLKNKLNLNERNLYTPGASYDTFEKYMSRNLDDDEKTKTDAEMFDQYQKAVAREEERNARFARHAKQNQQHSKDLVAIRSRERDSKVASAMSLLDNEWSKTILRDLNISIDQWMDMPDSQKKQIQDKYHMAWIAKDNKNNNRWVALMIIGSLVSIYIIAAGPEILTFIKGLFEENKPGDVENGKEVSVKTPLSKIDDMFKSSVEKSIFNKVKSKIPSYFKVKYNPNLGKKLDLDYKKFMITVSDLDLAKSLINVGTNLEENIESDFSIKNLLQIAKTQGKDGLEKSISDKI
jgi:hypothetical protein